MNNSFLLEEQDLLNTFLDKTIFDEENSFFIQTKMLDENFHYDNEIYPKLKQIELIIRPECNQKCEYCYITKHGKELYPFEERLSKDKILKNLDMLLDFIFNKKQVFIKQWEMFAGDLFYDGLFFDILDVFDKYYNQVFNKYKSLFLAKQVIILLPVNTSFSKKEENISKIRKYVNHFKEAYNIRLILSFSTDGKYAVDTREQNVLNDYDVDAYYDKLFELTNEFYFCFHPMISSSNVKNWIKNYDWWIENFNKYYLNHPINKDFQPMSLEVRNNDWNEESLQDYKKLLIHVFNKRLEMCNNDIDHLAYHLFKGDGKNNTLHENEQYDLLLMRKNTTNKISCSIQNLIHINLSNLSLVPCHRLTYQQFKGGNFVIENDEIVGVEPINPTLFLNIFYLNGSMLPKCFSCAYKHFCLRGCFGAQYETHGELFFPADKACDLLQTKYKTLIELYFNSGVFESALKQNLLSDEEFEEYKKILEILAVE